MRPEEIAESKRVVRHELDPLREAQFRIDSVQDFIRHVESPSKSSRRKSILNLIADGREIHARLQPALAAQGNERINLLQQAVQPYLQLVHADEPDEFTGLPLGEIWRYFRYTWSLPATNIPGRQLFYLIRDAAHPFHAIMGIEISEKFKTWAVKYLHELHEKESASRNDIIQSQQKAYQGCLLRIDNLVKLKTSPGNADGSLLSDKEYGVQRTELLKGKASLEELLRDAGHRVTQWLNLSEQTFEFARTARERFAKGDAKSKKEVLFTIGSNLVLKDKKLSIEAKKPFFLLDKAINDEGPENKPIESENISLSQGRNETNAPHRPTLLAGLEDVRAYGFKAERAAALIYAHFKKEFGVPSGQEE